MALLSVLAFAVFKFLAGSIIGRGILMALAKWGVRPEEWVADMIHASHQHADKPLVWIGSGIFGLLCLAAWEVFHIDDHLIAWLPTIQSASNHTRCCATVFDNIIDAIRGLDEQFGSHKEQDPDKFSKVITPYVNNLSSAIKGLDKWIADTEKFSLDQQKTLSSTTAN